MPQATTMHDSDIVGLIVIMAGLVLYRFTASPAAGDDGDDESVGGAANPINDEEEATNLLTVENTWGDEPAEGGLREPLLHGDI